MAVGDSLHGIASQNKREFVLQRWLAKPPLRAALLTLTVIAEAPLVLGEWQREEWNQTSALAADIMQRIDEYGEEAPHIVTRFALTFADETRASITTKTLTHRKVGDDENVDVARRLDGSNEAGMALQQKALEANTRMYLTGHQANMQAAQGVNQMLMQQNERLMQLLERQQDLSEQRHAEMLEAREAMLALQVPAGDNGELSESQKKAVELLEKFLPVVAMGLMKGNGQQA